MAVVTVVPRRRGIIISRHDVAGTDGCPPANTCVRWSVRPSTSVLVYDPVASRLVLYK